MPAIPTFVRQVDDFDDPRGTGTPRSPTRSRRFEPDLVVSAGFMKLLGDRLPRPVRRSLLNTHPALCPAFPGMHGPRDALEYGVKVTGARSSSSTPASTPARSWRRCAVPVAEDDDVESLHERIKTAERAMLVDAVGRIAREGFTVEGRRVRHRVAAR